MNTYRETERLPQPYTPTPDGFERRLRVWVNVPTDDGAPPDAMDVSAPPQEPGARDQAGGMTRTRKGHRRQRGGRSDV